MTPYTERFELFAEKLDAPFTISVGLPYSYRGSATDYPVLYSLDADLCFGTVSETARLLGVMQEIQEVLVVGVGYPDGLDFPAISRRRLHEFNDGADWDLTASPCGQRIKATCDRLGYEPRLGGAPALLEFLTQQLQPAIDERYRVTNQRGLLGASASGNFTLWALFTQPLAFSRWAAISPALAYNDGEVFRAESAHAERDHSLTGQLFLAAGADELVPYASLDIVGGTTRLAQTLALRAYEGFSYQTHLYPGVGHAGALSTALPHLLPALFPPG